MGERTVNTQSLPDAEAVVVTRQYVGGSLFKSQNGTIWTPSQFEDLKFKLRKAQFSTTAGTAFFYNPKLETNSGIIERLLPNAIRTLPRKLMLSVLENHFTELDFSKFFSESNFLSRTFPCRIIKSPLFFIFSSLILV